MTTPKPSWRKPWTKLDLSRDTLIAVFKNTLPSTAALWVIQSSRLGQEFDTVGFLPIIVTILMVPSQPRIPYLRLLLFTLALNCIVLCITLLAGYCATQARLHTTPTGASLGDYNSSAAAVCAIWLIFTVWALQTFRTFNPQRAKSVIPCTIFTVITLITSAELRDMDAIISFNLQLFQMFLLGYAFSAFTSLFIFPKGSRDVTSADIANMFDLVEKATSCDLPFGDPSISDTAAPPVDSAAAKVNVLGLAFAKFQIDVSDAKKDIGWSQYSPKDFSELVYQFRVLVTTLKGLFAVESIRSTLQFGPQASGFDKENGLKETDGTDGKEHWDHIFQQLQDPISQLHRLGEDAINHCRISLRVRGFQKNDPPPRETSIDHAADSEKAARALPGGAEFVGSFQKQVEQQRNTLKLLMGHLKELDGYTKPADRIDDEKTLHRNPTASQGRTLFAMYIENLYNGVLEALLELVMFCDHKYSHSQKKLQVPGKRKCVKIIRRLVEHHHVDGDLEDIGSEIPNLAPQRSRMPEPPMMSTRDKVMQKVGVCLDKPFEILGSPQSFFGLRVACAVMTIAIVAYLNQTQQWFFNQRGVWAAVFIPFSMAPSSGEAKSMLIYRVLGTMLSIPLSLLNWYIVVGTPAGVIVFYFILAFIQQYFLVKYVQWGSFWRPCLITYSIIVGYSLQEQYSSTPQPPATTTNQYPIYLIGPYRALCTLIGVSVAYIWTVFPQPTTANSVMRRRLGQALFTLAEYHSCMHEAISSWAGGHQGDIRDKSSVAHKLMKVRQRLFVKETAILTVIRDQHNFATFDVSPFSGTSYPEHRYVAIADEIDRIMTYLNVVIFVSVHFHHHIHTNILGGKTNTNDSTRSNSSPWSSGIPALLSACKRPSREIASLIHILASSVLNDQPLPPLLLTPEPFSVARKLRVTNSELLDVKYIGDEGYKAFAVIEVSVAMITKSLERVLNSVRDMVGEVGVGIVEEYADSDDYGSDRGQTKGKKGM